MGFSVFSIREFHRTLSQLRFRKYIVCCKSYSWTYVLFWLFGTYWLVAQNIILVADE